jgi:V/A-type H+-transporting ATPase subunit A
MRFIALSREALARGMAPDEIASLPVLRRLQRMGEEVGEDAIASFAALWPQLERELAAPGAAVAETGDAR